MTAHDDPEVSPDAAASHELEVPHQSSTHEELEQLRSQNIFQSAKSELAQLSHQLAVAAGGEQAIDDFEFGYRTSITREHFDRDYSPLVDAGFFLAGEAAHPGMMNVSPIRNRGPVWQQVEHAREVLSHQPFREKIAELASFTENLVQTTRVPGVHIAPVELSSDDVHLKNVLEYPGMLTKVHLNETPTGQAVSIELLGRVDHEESVFLHTDTAKVLYDALDSADVKLSGKAMQELATENDERYGNAYAWMSRELVKEIAGYDSKLFARDDRNYDDEDGAPRTKTRTEIPLTGDEGADLLIDIMNQLAVRTPEQAKKSDIPVYEGAVKVREDGCKDVEALFVQSHTYGVLSQVEINGKRFWHKQHGAKTFINLDPLTYKGIDLPPGFAFKRNAKTNNEFALMRATGFAFDKATADKLFGRPMTKSYELSNHEELAEYIFDRFASERDTGSNE